MSGQAAALAFTLAEMMVVLLIMSIVLACMAPVMTTKMKADQSIQTSPWRWAENNVDAYFSSSSNQSAMIGQNTKDDADSAKLIINNSTNLDDMISFKSGANTLGSIRFQNDGIRIGSSNTVVGQGSAGFGTDITATSNSVVFGNNSSAGNNGSVIGNSSSASDNAIIIGNSTNAFEGSVVIGNSINNTSGNSVSIGLRSNVTDVGGVAIGNQSTASKSGTAVGPGTSALGDFSVAIGLGATAGTETTTLSYGNAVAIGSNASALQNETIAIGSNSKSGTSSIMIGVNTGKANTTGYQNTVIGANAFINNTTGASNVGVGQFAMQQNTTGFGNVAFGTSALNANKTSNYNTAIGHFAGFTGTGKNNISIGAYAGYSTKGDNNIAIGEYACNNVKGNNKICIGNSSGPSSTLNNDEEVIYIGSAPKSTTSYFSTWNERSAVLEIWNVAATSTFPEQHGGRRRGYSDGPTVYINGNLQVRGYIGGLIADDRGDEYDEWGVLSSNKPTGDDRAVKWGYVSDRRLKYVGKENKDGLAKLRQIKVFNYTFKKDETKTPRVGVIAQDLQKIFPNAVKKGTDGFLSIRMEDMFYAVINAIKELDARYQAQEKRIDELEKRIKVLENKIK